MRYQKHLFLNKRCGGSFIFERSTLKVRLILSTNCNVFKQNLKISYSSVRDAKVILISFEFRGQDEAVQCGFCWDSYELFEVKCVMASS